MHFEGKLEVGAPVESVWKFVTTPDDFVKVIPDVQEYEALAQDKFRVAFKVGLGVIRGTVDMTFTFQSLEPNANAVVVGRGSGLQSTADLAITLRLAPEDGKTLVSWAADLTVGGLVASVGSRLLQSTTETKIREIVEGIRREVK